jgi:hypothetical protein
MKRVNSQDGMTNKVIFRFKFIILYIFSQGCHKWRFEHITSATRVWNLFIFLSFENF